MDRDLWSGLVTFAAIVEAGSFAKASARVGVSASTLSHAMRSLEAKLGVRLLDRTTRSLAPTDAGEELLLRLRPAIASVEQAVGDLEVMREQPAGRIRVNAHRVAAVYVIMPRVARLAKQCRDVVVELIVNDGLVDIVGERFDCGVRNEEELHLDMVSIRIGDPLQILFVAAPSYLATHGAPQVPDDLRQHRCLGYRFTSSGRIHRWEFERNGEAFERDVPACFISNDVDVIRDAAVAGLGITCLLREQAAPHLATGALVEVLAGWAPMPRPLYLYYPSRRQPSAAFRAFIQAMRS